MENYMGETYYTNDDDEYEDDEALYEPRLCRICHKPITNWQNTSDVHPNCVLKEEIQHIQHQTRFDGTGQDEEMLSEMI